MIDCDESDQGTPRWWIVTWSVWGLVIGAIVLWLDRSPLTSIGWAIAGFAIGTWGVAVSRPFASGIMDWYDNFAAEPLRDQRMFELAMDQQTESPEFDRLCRDEAFKAFAIAPPMMGLFHGTLIGSIAGAFSALDATLGVSASRGALCGAAIGVVGFAFLAALVFAVMSPLDNTRPIRSRIADRAFMVLSPLFVFPAALHCLRRMVKRRRMNAI